MDAVLTKPLRVLLLAQWFEPEPTLKGLVFAKELVHQGFDVEVITGFPNYPGGKVYPGYKIKLLQREVLDGIQITRVPIYPNHNQSALKRILNYASFALSSLIYCLFRAKSADILYAYHPPLTVGITASIVRLFRRMAVVYDIQDMWPDTISATGMLNNAQALRVVDFLCCWVYRRVDHIVVLSPGFKRLLIQRGVPATKISLIYNWADEVSLTGPVAELPAELSRPGVFHILFAGNMGKAQALDTVLKAALMLEQLGTKICWVMLGEGVELERLKSEAHRQKVTSVMFLPSVPMTHVGAYLQAADALLVHLRKDPLFEITIPSKTQAYMAAGKPLLMAVEGDAADLVRQSCGGVVADSESAEALALAAQTLYLKSADDLAAMGQRARTYYQKYLSLKVGVQRFSDLFKELARDL